MFCRNCGSEIRPEWKCCPNCKTNVMDTSYVVDNDNLEETMKKKKTEVAILVSVFLVAMVLAFAIEQITIAAFCVATISIVTAFIRNPQSRLVKVLFWLFIFLIVVYVLIIIFLLYTCNSAISSCGSAG